MERDVAAENCSLAAQRRAACDTNTDSAQRSLDIQRSAEDGGLSGRAVAARQYQRTGTGLGDAKTSGVGDRAKSKLSRAAAGAVGDIESGIAGKRHVCQR